MGNKNNNANRKFDQTNSQIPKTKKGNHDIKGVNKTKGGETKEKPYIRQ